MFGAIDEDQALGFPVAGKNTAANVRCELKFIFQLIKKTQTFCNFFNGAMHTICYLFQKLKLSFLHIILISKIMIKFCHLRLYLGNETVLFSPVMVKMDKGWANFFKF